MDHAIPRINKVAILGGIHGNELTGVYLIRKWKSDPDLITRPTFEVFAVHGNPRATEIGRRYVDKDLNRCFLSDDLSNLSLSSYEDNRAKVLNHSIGPKGNAKYEFLIDIHSSTSNIGITIIVTDSDIYSILMTSHLIKKYPELHIYMWHVNGDQPYVNSIFPMSVTIEVGPVANGVLDSRLLHNVEMLVYDMLDFIDKSNNGDRSINSHCQAYVHKDILTYPMDNTGNMTAMIHPQRMDRDFIMMSKGDPVFITFTGETVYYQDDDPVWPIFINEAAYYEKDIAMCLTRKMDIEIDMSSHRILESGAER